MELQSLMKHHIRDLNEFKGDIFEKFRQTQEDIADLYGIAEQSKIESVAKSSIVRELIKKNIRGETRVLEKLKHLGCWIKQ